MPNSDPAAAGHVQSTSSHAMAHAMPYQMHQQVGAVLRVLARARAFPWRPRRIVFAVPLPFSCVFSRALPFLWFLCLTPAMDLNMGMGFTLQQPPMVLSGGGLGGGMISEHLHGPYLQQGPRSHPSRGGHRRSASSASATSFRSVSSVGAASTCSLESGADEPKEGAGKEGAGEKEKPENSNRRCAKQSGRRSQRASRLGGG